MYVDLPHEDPDKLKDMVGLLLVHLYGTRAAADGWHCEYSGLLEELGFVKGDASACIFRHHLRNIVCSVHGDDFTSSGPKESLDWMKKKMEEKYELTESARLGPSCEDDKEVRVLNRIVRWTPEGIEYEADPRHVEQIVRDLDLMGAKSVTTPGLKPTFEQACHSGLLPPEKHRAFRAIAARANYLAVDRPDFQYAPKRSADGWRHSQRQASLL